MPDLHHLRLSLPPSEDTSLSSLISGVAADVLATLLKDTPKVLPPESQGVEIFCTHMRPHLDEYMAMLLFRACLPEAKRDLPLEETILTSATNDDTVRQNWARAAVFGLGGVQNGGARPLLLFDEHVQNGHSHHASSATAVVTGVLFGRTRLPHPLFLLLREIDLLDALGGAHPKHLANYTIRLHDYADANLTKLPPLNKRAVVEACLMAVLWAIHHNVPFWQESFWRERALRSLKQHVPTSALRPQNGFEQALVLLEHNLRTFRQPRFSLPADHLSGLSFPIRGTVFQTVLIPFIAALCPLVWGEETSLKVMGALWDARLMTQMRYTAILQTLEEHFGCEPEDGDVDTDIGLIRFRNVRMLSGNAGMTPWILEICPNPGMSNVRQALISFVRKHHADTAFTLLRNTENGSLVLSRGLGIPQDLWTALVDWLVAWEGSSDTEGQPGSWHVVTSALGTRADFVLNGNAAHRYVTPSKLTVDLLADWILHYPAR